MPLPPSICQCGRRKMKANATCGSCRTAARLAYRRPDKGSGYNHCGNKIETPPHIELRIQEYTRRVECGEPVFQLQDRWNRGYSL